MRVALCLFILSVLIAVATVAYVIYEASPHPGPGDTASQTALNL